MSVSVACLEASVITQSRPESCPAEVIAEECWTGHCTLTGPQKCTAKTGERAAANLRIGEGLRLCCYCLFDEGLNLVNPDLHMGFLI